MCNPAVPPSFSTAPEESISLDQTPVLWGAFSPTPVHSVLALTHHAVTAKWLSNDKQWSVVASRVEKSEDALATDIKKLATSLLNTDGILREAALSNPSKNALLTAAFDVEVTGKKANHMDFFWQLAQGLLLDRLVWLSDIPVGMQSRPSAHRWASLPSNELDRRLKPCQDALTEWPLLLSGFLESLTKTTSQTPSASSTVIDPGNGAISPHLLQRGAHTPAGDNGGDLLEAALYSEHMQDSMAVKANILDAAVGVRALLMIAGGGLQKNPRNGNDKKTIYYSYQASGQQAKNPNQSNLDYLRPVLVALGFSPVSLLVPSLINPKKETGNSTKPAPLEALAEGMGQASFQSTVELEEVERLLFDIILKLARSGPEDFDGLVMGHKASFLNSLTRYLPQGASRFAVHEDVPIWNEGPSEGSPRFVYHSRLFCGWMNGLISLAEGLTFRSISEVLSELERVGVASDQFRKGNGGKADEVSSTVAIVQRTSLASADDSTVGSATISPEEGGQQLAIANVPASRTAIGLGHGTGALTVGSLGEGTTQVKKQATAKSRRAKRAKQDSPKLSPEAEQDLHGAASKIRSSCELGASNQDNEAHPNVGRRDEDVSFPTVEGQQLSSSFPQTSVTFVPAISSRENDVAAPMELAVSTGGKGDLQPPVGVGVRSEPDCNHQTDVESSEFSLDTTAVDTSGDTASDARADCAAMDTSGDCTTMVTFIDAAAMDGTGDCATTDASGTAMDTSGDCAAMDASDEYAASPPSDPQGKSKDGCSELTQLEPNVLDSWGFENDAPMVSFHLCTTAQPGQQAIMPPQDVQLISDSPESPNRLPAAATQDQDGEACEGDAMFPEAGQDGGSATACSSHSDAMGGLESLAAISGFNGRDSPKKAANSTSEDNSTSCVEEAPRGEDSGERSVWFLPSRLRVEHYEGALLWGAKCVKVGEYHGLEDRDSFDMQSVAQFEQKDSVDELEEALGEHDCGGTASAGLGKRKRCDEDESVDVGIPLLRKRNRPPLGTLHVSGIDPVGWRVAESISFLRATRRAVPFMQLLPDKAPVPTDHRRLEALHKAMSYNGDLLLEGFMNGPDALEYLPCFGDLPEMDVIVFRCVIFTCERRVDEVGSGQVHIENEFIEVQLCKEMGDSLGILQIIQLHQVRLIPGTPGWDEKAGLFCGMDSGDAAIQCISEEDFLTVCDPVFSKKGLQVGLMKRYSGDAWDRLDSQQRKEALSLCNIFIDDLGWLLMPGIKGWTCDALKRQVSLLEPRKFAVASRTHQGVCISTLLDFVEHIPKDAHMKTVPRAKMLCTDIDLVASRTHDPPLLGLDDGRALSSFEFSGFQFRTGVPLSHTKWGVALHASMLSCPRIAPCGLCTFLQVVHGFVIIYVGKLSQGDVVNKKGLDPSSCVWQGLKMRAGDVFILRPATPFAMLAVEDSFLVGAHFYSSTVFLESLKGIVLHHLFGNLVTGACNTACLVVFIKTLALYEDGVPEEDLPSHENMAALLILVAHLDAFYLDQEQQENDWQSCTAFWEDLEMAKHMVLRLTWASSARSPRFKPQLECLEDEIEAYIRLNEHSWSLYRGDPDESWEPFSFRRLSRIEPGDFEGGLDLFDS